MGHETLTVRTVAQRAGVSPATAYTYLASKNHLFAELFWRHLVAQQPSDVAPDASAVERVQATVRALTARIMLRVLAIPHTVSFGLRRNESGELRAHAWVSVGPLIVTGGSREKWAEVASFAWAPRPGR